MIKADLHAHHSFVGLDRKSLLIEKIERRIGVEKKPSLKNIIKQIEKTDLDLVAITSCSDCQDIDRRWDAVISNIKNCEEDYEISLERDNRYLSVKNKDSKRIYLFHGQEFKTDKWDVNVLFAETMIPIVKSKGKFEYLIEASKDCGDNVIVTIPHPARGIRLLDDSAKKLLIKLYEERRIDAIEGHDALEINKNNENSKYLAGELKMPYIAVSDSHCLNDTGRAYTEFEIDKWKDYGGIIKEIGEKIRKKEFSVFEGRCPQTSRMRYIAKAMEAKFRDSMPFEFMKL